MNVRQVVLAAAVAFPAVAAGLEPRFDHRDTHGPFIETVVAHDTTTIAGATTVTSWRPTVRAGWGFDATGEGSELLLGVDIALRPFDDPDRQRVLLAASARYRSYFGTEELKTFLEAGLYAPIRSRLAAGPLVGFGAVYDFSRKFGLFIAAEFASAFGQARVITFAGVVGTQLRFELP